MADQKEIKNPIFECLLAICAGAVIGVIGYLKFDSTKTAATHGSVTMMVIGGVLVVAGLVGWQIFGNRK